MEHDNFYRVRWTSSNAIYVWATRLMILILIQSWCLDAYTQRLQFYRLDKRNTNISNQGSYSDGSIVKDSSGFVWIATNDGLNRWNGYEMKIYKPNRLDTNSIMTPTLTCMEIDKQNVMWIGTANEGIVRYYPREDRFDYIVSRSEVGSLAGSRINTIRCDSLGRIWIGTELNGLLRYDSATEEFVSYPIDNTPGVESIRRSIGGRDQPLVFLTSQGLFFPSGDPDSTRGIIHPLDEIPECIEYDPEGHIWLGYADRQDSSVMIYDPADQSLRQSQFKVSDEVYKIHYDGRETMWLASYDKLYQHHLPSGPWKCHAHDPDDQFTVTEGPIQEIITDADGLLWYSTESLGGGYVSTVDTFITQKEYSEVLQSFGDPRGSQVSNFIIRKSNYQQVMGLNEAIPEFENMTRDWIYQVVSPVFWDTEDAFWFYENTTSKLYRKKRNAAIEVFDMSHLGSVKVMDEDDQKRLWTNAKLAYFDLEKERWEYPNQLLSSKGQDTIVSNFNTHLALLQNGTVALATHDNGVYIYNPNDTSLYHMEAQPFVAGHLSSRAIFHIYEQRSSGKLYLSTKSVINIWNPIDSSITYIDRPDDKAFKFLCMSEDAEHNIWATNTRGIHYIKDDSLIGIFPILQLNRFHINAGSFTDQAGRVYNNHRHGPYQFNPSQIIQSTRPSKVIISDFYINRNRIHPNKNSDILQKAISFQPYIKLKYGNNDVGFGLACADGKLKNVKIYYQLTGYENDWVNLGNQNVVHFTNLDPGRYVFKVKGLSSGGSWTDEISEQSFVILSPWYATWYAYILYAGMLSLVLYSIYRYRINQLLRYQQLRTKISSDLHDDVGSLLSSLAWQTDIMRLTADDAMKVKYDKITSLSRSALERMRDTVWAIDSRKDDLEGLVDRMADFLVETFDEHHISYTFDHSLVTKKNRIAPDIRQNIYLIFKEALTNVKKHSNGATVVVSLTQNKNRLHLLIKDDGTVEKNKIKSSGLGLSNMTMRANRIGADFSQTWDDGCEISVKVDQISPL